MQLLKLIQLYFYVCEVYDNQIEYHVQRHTKNNSAPQFTDKEVITCYLFAVTYEKRLRIKDIHQCIDAHYRDWFPDLPTYETFNRRLNRLNPAFPALLAGLVVKWQQRALKSQEMKFLLTDSMPIITCAGNRDGKVARSITNKGYNSTKKIHFYGIKLHALSICEQGTLPALEYLILSSASEHDLNAQREILKNTSDQYVFADKAFKDSDLEKEYKKNGGELLIPVKYKKGQPKEDKQRHKSADDLYSKAVSSIRQPIESFFGWIIEKTDIQRASKVRSMKGLLVHTFGKITAAIFGRMDELELI